MLAFILNMALACVYASIRSISICNENNRIHAMETSIHYRETVTKGKETFVLVAKIVIGYISINIEIENIPMLSNKELALLSKV